MVEIRDVYIHPPHFDDPRLYEQIWPRCPPCQRPLVRGCVSIDGKLYHRRCVWGLLTPEQQLALSSEEP